MTVSHPTCCLIMHEAGGGRSSPRAWCFCHTHLGHLDPKAACHLGRGHEDVHAVPEACGDAVREDKGSHPFDDHARAERHPKCLFDIPGEGHHPPRTRWPEAVLPV